MGYIGQTPTKVPLTSADIADGTIALADMADDSVDSDQYVDGSIDAAHLSANSVDSDAYVDGSIDAVHLSANSVDSDSYVDGSIDTIHIGDDQVTGAKLNPALVSGDIIYADGTDTINRLAKPGTPAGEVLTFATSATAPSWVAAAASGLSSYTTGGAYNFGSVGTKTITTCPFQPTAAIFMSTATSFEAASWCLIAQTGSGSSVTHLLKRLTASGFSSRAASKIYDLNVGSLRSQGVFTSLDSAGMTWTHVEDSGWNSADAVTYVVMLLK